MEKRIYTIMGATGNIGHSLTETLLKQGHPVRAIGRDQKKLMVLKSHGAEIFMTESFDNAEVLNKAFKDAQAVFSFIPPAQEIDDYGAYQDKVGQAIKTAIAQNRVTHVVNLSSIGAHLAEGTGPIKGLHRQEERLNTLNNVALLHLRPEYFMENFLMGIPIIEHTGAYASPLRADLSIPFIATQDIAQKAAAFLHDLDFKGHTAFELIGPRAINLTEATNILGRAIGNPHLEYRQLPYAEAEKGLLNAGMRASIAKLMIEMSKAFNEGKCQPSLHLSAEHYGQTSFEDFSKTFAHAYQHKKRRLAI